MCVRATHGRTAIAPLRRRVDLAVTGTRNADDYGFDPNMNPQDSLTMSSVSRTTRRGGASGWLMRSTSARAAVLPISSRDTVVTVSGGLARLALPCHDKSC